MSMSVGGMTGGEPPMSMPGMEQASPVVARHGSDTHSPGNTTEATALHNQLGEPGTGLEDVGHRVLAYTDLRSLTQGYDQRPPTREIELHLTGNMDRCFHPSMQEDVRGSAINPPCKGSARGTAHERATRRHMAP